MDATTTLKNHNLRVTKIRLAILDALENGHQAKPYAELQATLSDFNRTTLYRTLLALIEKGLIHKALEENGESYYARCGGCTSYAHTHDHIHFKCNDCGTVECLHLSNELGFTLPGVAIDSLEITAKGTCKICNL
ncbi:MAG TPA: Fur family transcriptional regulator [Cryomorphaceae bacterium]|nr:Fur family transcriptional regulator [Cryomorphaceae bacterium]|tara:strand:+ start:1232 stop:1636 length:405 start_codon:yes stop_codon:yes gene_type:complete